jgi:hypothetical protein
MTRCHDLHGGGLESRLVNSQGRINRSNRSSREDRVAKRHARLSANLAIEDVSPSKPGIFPVGTAQPGGDYARHEIALMGVCHWPGRGLPTWGRFYDHDEARASLWRPKKDAQGQGEDRASPVTHGLGARTCAGAGAETRRLPTYRGAEMPPRQVAGGIGGCRRGRFQLRALITGCDS